MLSWAEMGLVLKIVAVLAQCHCSAQWAESVRLVAGNENAPPSAHVAIMLSPVRTAGACDGDFNPSSRRALRWFLHRDMRKKVCPGVHFLNDFPGIDLRSAQKIIMEPDR